MRETVGIMPGDRVKIRCHYLISYHSDLYKTSGLTGTVVQIQPIMGQHSHHVQFDQPVKGTYADLADAWYQVNQLTKIGGVTP